MVGSHKTLMISSTFQNIGYGRPTYKSSLNLLRLLVGISVNSECKPTAGPNNTPQINVDMSCNGRVYIRTISKYRSL